MTNHRTNSWLDEMQKKIRSVLSTDLSAGLSVAIIGIIVTLGISILVDMIGVVPLIELRRNLIDWFSKNERALLTLMIPIAVLGGLSNLLATIIGSAIRVREQKQVTREIKSVVTKGESYSPRPISEPLRVFISSSITEMRSERAAVKEALEAIPLTAPLTFEVTAVPSEDSENYLRLIEKSDLFILLISVSVPEPIVQEYQAAVKYQKPILIFVKAGEQPSPEEVEQFVRAIPVKWVNFHDADELKRLVQISVLDELVKAYRRYQPNQSGIVGFRHDGR